MDPVSGYLVDSLIGKVVARSVSAFRSHVIEPFATRKAEAFLEEFVKQVSSTGDCVTTESELSGRVDEVLGNEAYREALYDAYHSVCVARSKDLGPRLIAVLTARIISENRKASGEEECIFLVAESMHDDELKEFCRFYDEHHPRSGPADTKRSRMTMLSHDGKVMTIPWTSEKFDPESSAAQSISTGPMVMASCLGIWAEKLRGVGIMIDEISERTSGSRQVNDFFIESGSREIHRRIRITSVGWQLRELLRSIGV